MSAGDTLLSIGGNRLLDAAGNQMLSNGAGDACCCGDPACAYCADPPPKQITVRFADTAWGSGCLQIGSTYYKLAGANSINGKICLTQTSGCEWKFCQTGAGGTGGTGCRGYTTSSTAGCETGNTFHAGGICISLTKTATGWTLAAYMSGASGFKGYLFKKSITPEVANDCSAAQSFADNEQSEPGSYGGETWLGGGGSATITPGECPDQDDEDIAPVVDGDCQRVLGKCEVEIGYGEAVEMVSPGACYTCDTEYGAPGYCLGYNNAMKWTTVADPNGFYEFAGNGNQIIEALNEWKSYTTRVCTTVLSTSTMSDITVTLYVSCTGIQVKATWDGQFVFDTGVQPYTFDGKCQEFIFDNIYTDFQFCNCYGTGNPGLRTLGRNGKVRVLFKP